VSLLRASVAALLALALAACQSAPRVPSTPPQTKGFPGTNVQDSGYLPVDRSTPPPAGYGLYTVLLTRSANRNTLRLLSELFKSTDIAHKAVIARENLNLITFPVENAAEAERALANARNEPDAAAGALMQRYDFPQAAKLLASICGADADRGPAVEKACGSNLPAGPLLVTTQRALDGAVTRERILIVNLSNTSPAALPEFLAEYRDELQRKTVAPVALGGWRLGALDKVLDAAQVLPRIVDSAGRLPGFFKALSGDK
jgi:hypothetical protein